MRVIPSKSQMYETKSTIILKPTSIDDMEDDNIGDYFGGFGRVLNVEQMKWNDTGKKRGFGLWLFSPYSRRIHGRANKSILKMNIPGETKYLPPPCCGQNWNI